MTKEEYFNYMEYESESIEYFEEYDDDDCYYNSRD
jgi:hypothetical protein